MVFKKIKNTNCSISFVQLSERFVSEAKWETVNHYKLFDAFKNDFGHCYCYCYFASNKCYFMFWHYNYVLDINEYNNFVSKYCIQSENIIDWRQDGF